MVSMAKQSQMPSGSYQSASFKNVNHMKINKAKTNISLIKQDVLRSISQITKSNSKSVVASSGLSMQYAIMMGLIDYAQTQHTDKKIKFIVPVNCYGGTNDQARRIVECIENVEIIDLLVDGKNRLLRDIFKFTIF